MCFHHEEPSLPHGGCEPRCLGVSRGARQGGGQRRDRVLQWMTAEQGETSQFSPQFSHRPNNPLSSQR